MQIKTMKHLLVLAFIGILVLTSCGQKDVIFDEVLEMPWGQISLPTRWRIVNQDGDSLTLSSLEEEKLEVTINPIDVPNNFETWANSHAVKSGRLPVGKGVHTIDGSKVEYLITESTVGKIDIRERLYLLEIDGNHGLAVILSNPQKSRMTYQAEAIVDSIRISK